MKILNFFPLSIFQDQIDLGEEQKVTLVNEVRNMKNNSQNLNYKENITSPQLLILNAFKFLKKF